MNISGAACKRLLPFFDMKIDIKYTKAEKQRALQIAEIFRREYPDAQCELNYSTPLELAIATILSAQCTDKRVNMVTPGLFEKYRTLADWADVSQEQLEEDIHSTGFYRNKAKNIRAMIAQVRDVYHGELPNTMDELVKLSGVGRKTANVLLINAFAQPGITVDTHCKRISARLGFTQSSNPDVIERELKALLPEHEWAFFSHGIIFHGRRCCTARKPACEECPVRSLCPSAMVN